MKSTPPPTNMQAALEASAEAPAATVPAKTPLQPLQAVWHALCGREIDHYPRVTIDDKPVWLDTDTMMREFAEATSHWSKLPNINKADQGRLDDVIKLARQSLDEVKDQTEYQDQKAMRLLTVTTFLTAFSGVLFTRMLDAHPGTSFASQPGYAKLLLGVNYVLFAASVLSAVFGALITFHATRTRFKYVHDDDVSYGERAPRSRLFYRGILYVRPKAWALSFVGPHPGPDNLVEPILNHDLKQLYLRDLVGETYLISAKAADKLRYLDPAQRLLASSLSCLFFWLVSLTAVALFVPTPLPKPTIAQLTPASAVIPVVPTRASTQPIATSTPKSPLNTQTSATGAAQTPQPKATAAPVIASDSAPLPKGTAP